MESFFIDKTGGNEEDNEKVEVSLRVDSDDDEDDFLISSKINLLDDLPAVWKPGKTKTSKKSEVSLDNTYLITDYKKDNNESVSLSNVDKLLQRSVIKEGFEKLHSVPAEKSKKALKLERKKLNAKTKGTKWFDIPATEVTEEIKRDFEILKMRSALEKNHKYKKNNIKNIPKYFHVGRVVESSADFYSGRVPKSQRKRTMVEELLADAEFKKYQKKKFKEIMDENRRKKRTDKYLAQSKMSNKKGKKKSKK